jgi:aminoglycoside 6'-N-acetyltransferase
MIELAARPIGYLQFYRWADHTDPADPDDMDIPLEDDPWGVDIFIGEPDLVGTGIGSRAVALACAHLARVHAARTVLLTTELANLRAQGAYEKAGFAKVRHILDTDTRDGERAMCWLMRWDAPGG